MRKIIAGICQKHGYYQGSDCLKCIEEMSNTSNEVFYTNKDKLYDFYSTALDMKIESKTQWRNELKNRGLTDNFNQSWDGRKRDIEANISKQHNQRKHNSEVIKTNVREALKEMNMYSREKLFIPKNKAPKSMVYK